MSDLRAKKILLAFKEMIDAGVIEVKLDEDLEDWAEQLATLMEDHDEPDEAVERFNREVAPRYQPPGYSLNSERDDAYAPLREFVGYSSPSSWRIDTAPVTIPEPVDDPESRRVNDELWNRRMRAYRDFVARSQDELRPRTGRLFDRLDPSTEDD